MTKCKCKKDRLTSYAMSSFESCVLFVDCICIGAWTRSFSEFADSDMRQANDHPSRIFIWKYALQFSSTQIYFNTNTNYSLPPQVQLFWVYKPLISSRHLWSKWTQTCIVKLFNSTRQWVHSTTPPNCRWDFQNISGWQHSNRLTFESCLFSQFSCSMLAIFCVCLETLSLIVMNPILTPN